MGVKAKYKAGRLKYYSGAVDDESVSQSTAPSTAISNYGITRIKYGTSEGVWLLEAPVLGAQKKIVVADTTCKVYIRTIAATINNSTDDVLTIQPQAGAQELGVGFNFYGASTNQWYMVSGISDITGADVTITLTSTT
jgi:hypothetical protein